jgi:glycosyltransferase involved in cell wall biosynthesis
MGYEAYLTHIPLSYVALRRGTYDLAHAVYPTDALAAARWAQKSGRRALLSYMGVPETAWLRASKLRLEVLRRAAAGCDAVVALSRYAAEVFERSLGVRAHVIAPGVDLDAFRPAGARSPRQTIICPAAVEVERKNVGLLVDAFALVRRQRPDARLVLSLPPPASAPAVARLSAPGVEWAQLDDRAALARAYGEAWIAALPSVGEAFGLVLVEALACGTPVVGYAHSAIPEVIDRPAIGRLFDRLEPRSLASALLEGLELATDERTARACRARAEDFSVDRCTSAYLALYRRLLDGSTSGPPSPRDAPRTAAVA